MIVLESINDIGLARDNACPSAADLIAAPSAADRARARARPQDFRRDPDAVRGRRLLDEGRRGQAQAINDWIRTSKVYDGVVDFDAAVRDPNAPTKLQPQFNPGDNLHLNDAGYQAMANAIDLGLFKKK